MSITTIRAQTAKQLGESTAGTPQGSLDLTAVERVTYDEPKGPGAKRDPTKFAIYLEGRPSNDPAMRLKALTPSEAEKWVNGLTEWAAYCRATMAPKPAPALDAKTRLHRLL